MKAIYENMLGAVGRTPLVRLGKIGNFPTRGMTLRRGR